MDASALFQVNSRAEERFHVPYVAPSLPQDFLAQPASGVGHRQGVRVSCPAAVSTKRSRLRDLPVETAGEDIDRRSALYSNAVDGGGQPAWPARAGGGEEGAVSAPRCRFLDGA